MKPAIKLYNTLTRTLEPLTPVTADQIGIYWCGPTTYAPAHLGHARSAVVLDTIVRTLRHAGYGVRSVRNITDVGHMLADSDEGEDKVSKAARLAQKSPMEVVQYYVNQYHEMLGYLGTLPVSIEPRASGHITEQIALVERLLTQGFAYEVNGSVYFDVPAFHKKYGYGKLSNRSIKELLTGTRALAGTAEKRSPLDFALWKKAAPDHLMRWPSPWGEGFPGWHLECTAMSNAYLGLPFDIHGGGLDLCFPHHECEVAQAEAAYGKAPARYWVHHNMVTLAGKKMSKSAGHFITVEECLHGTHPLLSQAYTPMAIRMLLLQAHYRSPLDISDHALSAAQKGYYKLLNGVKMLDESRSNPTHRAKGEEKVDDAINQLCQACYDDLYHDFNTPKVLAHLFALLGYIQQIAQGVLPLTQLSKATWERLHTTYSTFVTQVLGLTNSHQVDLEPLVKTLIQAYTKAKQQQDYTQVDAIRAALRTQGIALQDRRDGSVGWQYVG